MMHFKIVYINGILKSYKSLENQKYFRINLVNDGNGNMNVTKQFVSESLENL